MRTSMTDEILLESRRDLRERAFQALMALGHDGDIVELVALLIYMMGPSRRQRSRSSCLFLMNLVAGVYQSKDQLDQQIGQHLKIAGL